jgi:hypothetical protein
MSRSVSVPSNAEVVCYQHHESYYWCDTCEERVDSEICPEDTSNHDLESEEEGLYCHDDCDEVVHDEHDEIHVVYLTSDYSEWDEFIYDVQWRCQEEWPSLEEIDVWIGRENHAILENGHVRVGVSKYGELAAVWIVPQDNDYYPEHVNLALHWIGQIEGKFRKMFGELRRIGVFSNGESVYRKVA